MADTQADRDALAAVKQLWDKEATLGGKTGELKTGRLKSPATPAASGKPYAHIESEDSGKGTYFAASQPNVDASGNALPGFSMSGTPYIDVRKVTIRALGQAADMDSLAAAINTKLAWLPKNGAALQFTPPIAFMGLRPTGPPKLSEEEATKEGQDIWSLVAEFELLTTRING